MKKSTIKGGEQERREEKLFYGETKVFLKGGEKVEAESSIVH